jgi:hypothetical protein
MMTPNNNHSDNVIYRPMLREDIDLAIDTLISKSEVVIDRPKGTIIRRDAV